MNREELISDYFTRFVARTDAYYTQRSDGGYTAKYEQITPSHISRHVNGEITIAFPAVDKNGLCKWICYDDDNCLPHEETGLLDLLEEFLRSEGYSSVREGCRPVLDKFKQGHLWIIFNEPLDAKLAQAWTKWVLKQLGLPERIAKLDIFPRQSNSGLLSNPVRGPLGKHVKASGERGWFRDAPLAVEAQLEWLAGQPLNDSNKIATAAASYLSSAEARNKYRSNFTKPRQIGKSNPSVLEMMDALHWPYRSERDRFVSQCPVCALEGHDKSLDNLHISTDDTWYGCWYQGWNEAHTYGAIYSAFRSLRRT